MAANILQNTLYMLLEARMSRSRGELLCSSHSLDSGPSSHGKYFIILLVFTVDLSLDVFKDGWWAPHFLCHFNGLLRTIHVFSGHRSKRLLARSGVWDTSVRVSPLLSTIIHSSRPIHARTFTVILIRGAQMKRSIIFIRLMDKLWLQYCCLLMTIPTFQAGNSEQCTAELSTDPQPPLILVSNRAPIKTMECTSCHLTHNFWLQSRSWAKCNWEIQFLATIFMVSWSLPSLPSLQSRAVMVSTCQDSH